MDEFFHGQRGHRSVAVLATGTHSLQATPRSYGWTGVWIAAVCSSLALTPLGAAEESVPDRPIVTVIAAGTMVDEPERDRWNRIVLLATPRFTSGDTADVSESITNAVSQFTFTILATVRPAADATEPAAHDLVEVGIGYSVPVNGQLTVIAPDAQFPSVPLDFMGRQVLNAEQKSLGDITCVGANDTAFVFDSPTITLRDDEHINLVVRHMVRIDRRSGACSSCAWLLEAGSDGSLVPVDEPLRLIDGGTREERSIHVDGRRFMFGFPTKQAFAVEDLPPGRRIDWSTTLRTAADAPAYTAPALDTLTAALDAAIASLRTLRSAESSNAAGE